MAREILASSLGRLISRKRGLVFLSVPVDMPPGFLDCIADSANSARGEEHAFHVSNDTNITGGISSERATELRSREDGSEANALIVAKEGEFKELKSLEAFRHVNPQSIFQGKIFNLER